MSFRVRQNVFQVSHFQSGLYGKEHLAPPTQASQKELHCPLECHLWLFKFKLLQLNHNNNSVSQSHWSQFKCSGATHGFSYCSGHHRQKGSPHGRMWLQSKPPLCPIPASRTDLSRAPAGGAAVSRPVPLGHQEHLALESLKYILVV